MNNILNFIKNNQDLVSVKRSIKYPSLRVVKYKRKVFYDNLWTPELLELRGLVIDDNDRVVVRPFKKIFNRFENGIDFDRNEPVTSIRKINGFMAALTFDPVFGPIVSTTGSLDSGFVAVAKTHLLTQNVLKNLDTVGVTFLFEIVDLSDPHIIKEQCGAYLIGARYIESGNMMREPFLDSIAGSFGFMRPEHKIELFSETVKEAKDAKHEGFVVYKYSGEALKIKSPYYMTKKFFMRVNEKTLTPTWLICNRNTFDEEYYPLIDNITKNRELFLSLDETNRRLYIENFLRGIQNA